MVDTFLKNRTQDRYITISQYHMQKYVDYLHICIFFVPSDTALAFNHAHHPQKANSPAATFAPYSPYFSLLEIYAKTVDLIIRHLAPHYQASLSECQTSYEIDNIYLFAYIFSLYLRMCIFCRTFAWFYADQ